jgi:hypothetical protein
MKTVAILLMSVGQTMGRRFSVESTDQVGERVNSRIQIEARSR